jgi:hypothetical protein
MGRNMFGPVRGPGGNSPWTGWWGDDPPYHTSVFVLTYHPCEPLQMRGGTTFHFVTDGIEAVLERAADASGGKDVTVGGGAETAQQHLRARLVDEGDTGDRAETGANVAAALEGDEPAFAALVDARGPDPAPPAQLVGEGDRDGPRDERGLRARRAYRRAIPFADRAQSS